MSKILRKAALVAALTVAASATLVQPAHAKSTIYHNNASDYTAVRVHSGWNCTGTVGSVPRGRWSGWAVDAITIGDGASLWKWRSTINPVERGWVRIAYNAPGGAALQCVNVGNLWERDFRTVRGSSL